MLMLKKKKFKNRIKMIRQNLIFQHMMINLKNRINNQTKQIMIWIYWVLMIKKMQFKMNKSKIKISSKIQIFFKMIMYNNKMKKFKKN